MPVPGKRDHSAESLQNSQNDSPKRHSGNRLQSAEHDNYERSQQKRTSEVWAEGVEHAQQRSRKSGKGGAKAEGEARGALIVHADELGCIRVLDESAHGPAKPAAVKNNLQDDHAEHRSGEDDQIDFGN